MENRVIVDKITQRIDAIKREIANVDPNEACAMDLINTKWSLIDGLLIALRIAKGQE